MRSDVIAALRTASEGLLCRSETDEPFTPFSWGRAEAELTPVQVSRLAAAPAGARIEDKPLAAFIQEQAAQDPDDAAQYRQLQQVIDRQLAGARVYRVGSVNIDVYIVGRTGDGEWVGLKSRAVET
jgi:hypothetical protein